MMQAKQKRSSNIAYQAGMKSMNGSNVKALCNICHGTGYAVSNIIVSDYDPDTPIQIGTPCPKCKGRADLGNPVFPSIYSEAGYEQV